MHVSDTTLHFVILSQIKYYQTKKDEANLTVAHTHYLLEKGIAPADISIITPYSLQVSLIRKKLAAIGCTDEIKVNSVDGFQGKENEVIIMSLVRSNQRSEIGFVSDKKRLNVAMTRAKRQLVVVCDLGVFSKHKLFESMIEYFNEHAQHISGISLSGKIIELTSNYPKFGTSGHFLSEPVKRFPTKIVQQKSQNKNENINSKEILENVSNDHGISANENISKFIDEKLSQQNLKPKSRQNNSTNVSNKKPDILDLKIKPTEEPSMAPIEIKLPVKNQTKKPKNNVIKPFYGFIIKMSANFLLTDTF